MRDSPVSRNASGFVAEAPNVSLARTAKPSIAEREKGGTGAAARTSEARTRPKAFPRSQRSEANGPRGTTRRKRAFACATGTSVAKPRPRTDRAIVRRMPARVKERGFVRGDRNVNTPTAACVRVAGDPMSITPIPQVSRGPPPSAAYVPSDETVARSNVTAFMRKHSIASYEALVERSVTDLEWFWGAVEQELGIEWSSPYSRVLDESKGPQWPR